MKKKVVLMALIPALAVMSCTRGKEAESSVPTVPLDFKVSFADTKAVFGEESDEYFPVSWGTSDKMKLVVNNSVLDGEFSTDSDGNFSATVPEANSYKFGVLYPAEGFKSYSSGSGFNTVIPPYQKCTEYSPDPLAIVLAAYTDISEMPLPSPISLHFNHLSAYLHFKITNLNEIAEDGSSIKSVTVTHKGTGEDDYLADRVYFKYVVSKKQWEKNKNSMTRSVIVETASTESIWCAISPVNLQEKTLCFTVTTENGYSYSKDVTFGSDDKFNLKSGQVATFTVNMNKSGKEAKLDELEEYELLMQNDLQTGDEILIVAANKDYDYAISTAQNSYNRGQFYVDVDRDNGVIVNPSASVERFTVEEAENGYYLKTSEDGYLYYKSGAEDNNLYTNESVSSEMVWKVSFSEGENGTVTDIENNSKHISYNFDSSIFAAYSNNDETKKRCRVQIYKKKTPSLSVDSEHANIGSEQSYSITISSNIAWTASADNNVVTLSSYSGNGPETITVTPTAYSELDTRDITVTITPDPRAKKLSEKTVTLTQYGRLWYEDWDGGLKSQTPSAYLTSVGKSNKVLRNNNDDLSYSSTNGGYTGGVKLYDDGLVFLDSESGGTTEEAKNYVTSEQTVMNLMINSKQKDGSGVPGSFTVSGIPCSNVKKAKLTYYSNSKMNVNRRLTSETEGLIWGEMYSDKTIPNSYSYGGSTASKDYHVISIEIDLSNVQTNTFEITFPNASSGANIRITQLEVKAIEMR